MKGKSDIRTFCHKCRADYENTGNYNIERVDPKQKTKEKCDYCSVRDGYDYEITKKERRIKR
jgi:hypothetical protein